MMRLYNLVRHPTGGLARSGGESRDDGWNI